MSKAVILAWGFAGVGLIDLVWIDATLLPRVVGSRGTRDTEVASAGLLGSSTSTSTSTIPTTAADPGKKGGDVDVDVDVDDPTPATVRFATVGETRIGPENQAELDAIVARMKTTGRRVVVEGHADARGSKRVNLDVSKRRAQAVAQALIDRGADPKRVEVRWFGERKPAVRGVGEAAWAANRRAEIEWRGNE